MAGSHPDRDFPPYITELFWDVEPSAVDPDSHVDYVLERVMSHGGWDAMRWLRRTYALDVLRDFLERKGQRLAPREFAYWALIADVSVPPEHGGGRPQ